MAEKPADKASAPAELPATQPPMVLEQHESGLWMYSRGAWVGGPAIEKNGCSMSITTEEAAKTYVNGLYPGAFPEDEAKKAPEKK